jgi:hypothetical protein
MRWPFSINLLGSQVTGERISKTQNRVPDKHFVRCERELCGIILKPL